MGLEQILIKTKAKKSTIDSSIFNVTSSVGNSGDLDCEHVNSLEHDFVRNYILSLVGL